MTWIDVSKFATEHNCIEEYDADLKTSVLNEDKVEMDLSIF